MKKKPAISDEEKRYMKAMGADLGRIFYELRSECIWLRWRIDEFEALYGTSQERIRVMNKTAPSFFGLLEEMFWDDMTLSLCRLTDEDYTPRTGPVKKALSIKRLAEHIDQAIEQEVQRLIRIAQKKMKFAKEWRNRLIGHRNLDQVLNPAAHTLPAKTRNKIKAAFVAISDVLDCVSQHFMGSADGYEVEVKLGGAEALLRILREGSDSIDDHRQTPPANQRGRHRWHREL